MMILDKGLHFLGHPIYRDAGAFHPVYTGTLSGTPVPLRGADYRSGRNISPFRSFMFQFFC